MSFVEKKTEPPKGSSGYSTARTGGLKSATRSPAKIFQVSRHDGEAVFKGLCGDHAVRHIQRRVEESEEPATVPNYPVPESLAPVSSFSLPVGVVLTGRSPAFRAGGPRSYASGTSSLALETRRARRHPREGSPSA